MNLFFRKVSIALFMALALRLCSFSSLAQQGYFVLTDFKALQESYFRLGDSLLKAEIGSFTFVGSLMEMSTDAGLNEFEIEYISSDSLLLWLDNYHIMITASRFRTFEHDLGFVPGENYLRFIDGKHYWGYDGRVPRRKMDFVSIQREHETIKLPITSYDDLFEPNLCRKRRFLIFNETLHCNTRAFLSADQQRIYIHMTNSRAPLRYEVTWIIRNGKYMGRILDYTH